ncbi:hypothetical protein LSAT2_018849 [Lamellibrachia satsuma]|nr:hypothetical protein LSAT2_018849 [Lamellibrachia satsuma]
MAENRGQLPEYEFDRSNFEELLAIELAKTPDGDVFRPSLADKQKVGFFSLDVASQTDQTEIFNIKHLTNVVQALLTDAARMRNDIDFTIHVMQADFEQKLRAKAIDLYQRVNDKITDIEKRHSERVGTVRRAFRQQLNDALVTLRAHWEKVVQQEVYLERKKLKGSSGELMDKVKGLQMALIQKDGVISLLKIQIEQFEEREHMLKERGVTPGMDPEELTNIHLRIEELEQTIQKLTTKMSYKEDIINDLTEELNTLSNDLERERVLARELKNLRGMTQKSEADGKTALEEQRRRLYFDGMYPRVQHKVTQTHRDDSTSDGDSLDIPRGLSNIERESQQGSGGSIRRRRPKRSTDSKGSKSDRSSRISVKSFIKPYPKRSTTTGSTVSSHYSEEYLKVDMEHPFTAITALQQMLRSMHSQRELLEQEFEERLRAAKDEAYEAARREAEGLHTASEMKIKQLQESKMLSDSMLAKEIQKTGKKTDTEAELARLAKSEDVLREELARTKREVEKVHRTWEKKFAILQQSLHALKDESFLRHTLQRQSAQLHMASISFAYDVPMVEPNAKMSSHSGSGKKRLPGIPKNSKSPQDYISYTVSAPSGRATAVFSTDENQVLDVDEYGELPDDIVPLPQPPERGEATFED